MATNNLSAQTTDSQPRFAPDNPAWRQLPVNLGMRAAGRMGVALNGLFGSRAAGRPGILTYHRVATRVPGFQPPLHNVEPRRFAEQLAGLVARGFQFIPLRRLLAAAERGETLPARCVVITFDDGFGSVFTEAWPVLKRMRIPATVFVNTAYLDSDEPFPFDAWGTAHCRRVPLDTYRPLRTAECHEMLEEGLIEIGAHTHTHEDFRGRPACFREDLLQSVKIVRERFHLDEVTFAFPYGGVHSGFASVETAQAAADAGVKCGLTTMAELVDLSHSPFNWGRFNVFAWDTSATLTAKLGGWYSWAPKTRQAVTRFLTSQKPPSAAAPAFSGLARG